MKMLFGIIISLRRIGTSKTTYQIDRHVAPKRRSEIDALLCVDGITDRLLHAVTPDVYISSIVLFVFVLQCENIKGD